MFRRTSMALVALALATSVTAAPDLTGPGRFAVGVTTVDAVDSSRADRTLPTESCTTPTGRSRSGPGT